MIRVGIVGAAGYAARELIGLLARHPQVELVSLVSGSQAGVKVAAFHSDFGIPETLRFTSELNPDVDVVCMCGGHGASAEYFTKFKLDPQLKVIDLSMDFRTDDRFTYGLPEIHKGKVRHWIANPGCFATVLQLSMLPLMGIAGEEWHTHAVTGSSGAGQALQESSHFSWRAHNMSAYKVFDHQHLKEIRYHGEKAAKRQGNYPLPEIAFVPVRGPFTRGIFATSYCKCALSAAEITALYKDYYADSAFTKIVEEAPDLKQVTGTNLCLIYPEKKGDRLFVTGVLDNLLKGAAGQAVENLNTLFELPPHTGLDLKPLYV